MDVAANSQPGASGEATSDYCLERGNSGSEGFIVTIDNGVHESGEI